MIGEIIKRNFAVGEEWLYLKIYMRSYFADKILIKLNDFLLNKINEDKVNKWFFVRYADPDFHIRIRMYIPNRDEISNILFEVNTLLENEINERIVSIALDTYSREVERYDSSCIELMEELFFHDTITVISILKKIEESQLTEKDRWIYGLVALDRTLTDFKFGLDEKLNFVSNINSLFSFEFEKDKLLNKDLDRAFREYQELISNNMNNTNIFSELLIHRSNENKPNIEKIILLNEEKVLVQNIPSILSSYIHLNCNRLFRITSRKQEYILYDFLTRFYTKEFYRNC
jgi:thiopeptide-type bacteriocin biosynthesis protein